ncbi:hypothetical protein PspLS_02479 [Pyricularia sp. CBS 133598]|nr:hypothetical protein PspLS_02479 [Pyricularia sp. CBS 133598]
MAPGNLNAGAGGGPASANASSRASPAINNHSNPKSTHGLPVNSNGYHPPKGQQLPLSSMTSPPLDLDSVERRGQPTAAREPLKRRERLNGVEEAPTYYPTAEEFKEPMTYMRKIAPEARKYGICKIVPPDTWNPPFAIDTQKFHFRTRKQELNSVEGSTRVNMNYVDALVKFHNQNGKEIRLPYVDKKPLDLYRLKKAVENRGGFDKVCKSKKWAEIGRDLGYSGKIMSSLSTSLKNSYQKFLCPYEEYLRAARPGVHQQLELEYGGPLTPSPAPSPMKKSNINTPASARAGSPTRQASDALQATVNGKSTASKDSLNSTKSAPSPAPQPASGFTSINSGGFKAVNTGGFTSVNRTPLPTGDSTTSTPVKSLAAAVSAKNTPEYRSSALGAANALKRQLSCDSLDSRNENGDSKEDADSNSRRSKRIKKENVPTVAGSHMTLFRPSLPRFLKDDSTPSPDKCHLCARGKETGFIVVCESCDYGYHGMCLDPPLKTKPDTEWNCPRCLVGDGRFGFEEGGLYSLKQFQERAADFKQSYFEKKMPVDPQLNCHRPVTEDDVEREFWRLVSSIEETVEVEYGADIHCTTHGSGFPTAEKNPDDPYSTDPWNLNILPLHPESLFRYIKSDISGMTVPWVYVGMIFSTFCWHNEDHYSYSANYQHFGATKTWYGIPGEDAEKFEAAMREAIPELFATQPDLLFQLVTLLPPEQLKKAGVRVYAIDQRAGQFVITFPQAYHAGFNHGFNFNEAVNFAPSDWEPFGLAGVERLQQFRRQPCFSHDELLWTAAEGIASGGLTIQTAKWLAPALERIHSRELAQRQAFVTKHKDLAQHSCAVAGGEDSSCLLSFKVEDEDVPEEEYQCSYCKVYTYLSRFKCLKSGQVLCLLHAGHHACCDAPEQNRLLGDQHVILYRKAEDIIAATYKKVADKASVPEAWEEKYDKILSEEATPSLKSLRNLLNEGEKIPFNLPSLAMLKTFVERCNRWVEDAANYTARKQQNRRKTDKSWRASISKASDIPEPKDREVRSVGHMYKLMSEAEQLGFDCPEILQLQERAEAIKVFQENAQRVLEHSSTSTQSIDTVEELLEEGHSFNVDIPEVEKLSHVLDQLKWSQKARQKRGTFISLNEVKELIEEGNRLGIRSYNDHMVHYNDQLNAGEQWERKAQEIINADAIHYAQLEALSQQATVNALPVSQTTLAEVDRILFKQREALGQIQDLNARCRNADHRKRPMYAEVCEIMKKVEELQHKPNGTPELEKEQRRHEDWMRKGKKLFGKTNAPLHILKSHLEYVLERNSDCFDIGHDKPRVPAEPASREPSPDAEPKLHRWEDPRFREVFCICRRTEAGMMIECELCHEWYHGKCLKVARGKIREDDKYTCPICDWRVPIPRDASRPNLEDLLSWYDEIPGLPFQPEEEGVLKQIIDNAQDFRNHIGPYCNNPMATASEVETQRFYLRKLEGAEILLAYETNFFRRELHKWSPVAPQPPPMVEVSKSTRKPRPTKLQKLFTQYGVDNVDDLPESVRGKANSLKRKALNAEAAAAAAAAVSSTGTNPASLSPAMQTPGSAHRFGGDRSYYSGPSSSQPSTPGLPMAGSTHGHTSRPSDAGQSPSLVHRQPGESPLNRADPLGINGSIHPGLLGTEPAQPGPRLMMGDAGSSTSSHALEERILNGQIDEATLQNEKPKVLEILGRTEAGRRQAEQLYGHAVWGGAVGAAESSEEGKDGGVEVERMFTDLVNHDDVTAETLESERNGMDALLDGE